MKHRRRNYRDPADGIDLLTLIVSGIAGMVGKLWGKLRRRK